MFNPQVHLPHISEAISYADQTASTFWSGFIGTVIAKVPESQPFVVLVFVERIQVFRIVVDRTGTGCPASCAISGAVGHLRLRRTLISNDFTTFPRLEVTSLHLFFFLLLTTALRYETTANGCLRTGFFFLLFHYHWLWCLNCTHESSLGGAPLFSVQLINIRMIIRRNLLRPALLTSFAEHSEALMMI